MDYNVQKVPNTGESKPLDATTPGGEVPQDPVDQIHEVQVQIPLNIVERWGRNLTAPNNVNCTSPTGG